MSKQKNHVQLFLYFNSDWLKGFCAGSSRKKADVVSRLKNVLRAIDNPCKIGLVVEPGAYATVSWSVEVDYKGWTPPRGCQMVQLKKMARELVKGELERMAR